MFLVNYINEPKYVSSSISISGFASRNFSSDLIFLKRLASRRLSISSIFFCRSSSDLMDLNVNRSISM